MCCFLMPPTTRRESRTFGAAPAPADAPGSGLNLEMILDNFEQCTCTG